MFVFINIFIRYHYVTKNGGKTNLRAPFLFHLPESRSLYELAQVKACIILMEIRCDPASPRHWQVLVQERFSLSNSTVKIATPSIAKQKETKL